MGEAVALAGAPAPTPPFKLRYACHLGVRSIEAPWFRETLNSLDPVVHIEYAAALGFAGISDNWARTRPVADQARVGEAVARCGLEVGCIVGSLELDRHAWVSAGEAAEAEVDAVVDAAIETAKRAGGRYLAIIPARHPSAPLGYQLSALIDHLRRVAPRAERAGVLLLLEQTSPTRVAGALLTHVADARLVVRAVDHPAVRMQFDFFHVQTTTGDLLCHLDQCWNDTALLQIADLPERREFGGSELNWPVILGWIRDRGYGGLVELEIIPGGTGAAGEQAALNALRACDAAL